MIYIITAFFLFVLPSSTESNTTRRLVPHARRQACTCNGPRRQARNSYRHPANCYRPTWCLEEPTSKTRPAVDPPTSTAGHSPTARTARPWTLVPADLPKKEDPLGNPTQRKGPAGLAQAGLHHREQASERGAIRLATRYVLCPARQKEKRRHV